MALHILRQQGLGIAKVRGCPAPWEGGDECWLIQKWCQQYSSRDSHCIMKTLSLATKRSGGIEGCSNTQDWEALLHCQFIKNTATTLQTLKNSQTQELNTAMYSETPDLRQVKGYFQPKLSRDAHPFFISTG